MMTPARAALIPNKKLLKSLLFFIFALAPVSFVAAQPNYDVAYWLDRDTAAVVDVKNIATTIDRMSELDLFKNPRFLKAIKMLSGDRFPILKSEDYVRVWEKLDEIKERLKGLGQVTFVLHRFDEEAFAWSVFLGSADELVLEKLENAFVEADELFRGSVKLTKAKKTVENEAAGDDLLKEEVKDNLKDSDSESAGQKKSEPSKPIEIGPMAKDLGWCKVQKIGVWLALSNHPTLFSELPERINDPKFKSLGKSRKYRAVGLRKSPLNKKDGRVTIYAMPLQLLQFFPNYTKESWEDLQIKELPACGINIVIPETDDSIKSPKPIILADAVVKFTQPASGYAKQFQFCRPFSIPKLAVEPIELFAISQDEKRMVEESIKTYDAKHGVGTAEAFWESRFAGSEVDLFDDVVPRRRSLVQMRFVDKNHSVNEPGRLTLDQVNDYFAAKRFGAGIAKLSEVESKRKLKVKEVEEKVWWLPDSKSDFRADLSNLLQGLEEASVEAKKSNSNNEEKLSEFSNLQNTGGFMVDRIKENRFDFMDTTQDAYVLSKDWFVQGDMPAVEQQVDLFDSKEGKDFGEPIREMIADLEKRLKPNGPTVMVKYFTSKSWQENVNAVEDAYAQENTTPVEMKIDFERLVSSRGVIDIGILQDPKSGSKSYDLVVKDPETGKKIEDSKSDGVLEKVEESPENKKDDDSPDGKKAAGNGSFVVELPMPLGERNEDGYRFALDSRRDLQKAVEVMLLTSIAESFPRQMFLYSKEEGYFRVIGGVYADPVKGTRE